MGWQGWAVVLVSALAGVPVRADECPVTALHGAPALRSRPAGERLQYIDTRLQSDARNGRLWSYSWATAYSALAIGQVAVAPFSSRANAEDLYVGGGASLIGLAPLLIAPLKVIKDSRRIEALASASSADRCSSLLEAERLLERDAENEAQGRSLLFHGGNVAFNVGLFFLMGAGFGHWTSATISLLTGIATGELMIFTQPMGAVHTLRDYRAGELSAGAAMHPFAMLLVPLVGAGRAGLSLVSTF